MFYLVRVAIEYTRSFALHATKYILETLDNGKQSFVAEFKFIDNTSVNRNVSKLNVRNTYEIVEKENSKYLFSSN